MKMLRPFLFAAAMAAVLHLVFAVVPVVALPLALAYFIGALLALSYYDYHRHYAMHR
tara:strand:- start:373 stop:543 length:171 start_codon:yes stop_codon:yes gene_type:complete